jgi:D-xylose transport system substrate-binding protein
MKSTFCLMGFMILGLLTSCHKGEPLKIGFLLPNLTDGRYPKDRDFFVEKVKQLGGSVEVGDGNNDAARQESQAKEMIDKGIKVLVIAAVNQYSAASIVRLAHDKGIKVIAYERLVQNCKLDYFIGFDHYAVGKQQAAYAIKNAPAGNYILVGGDKSDKNAELIKKGQLEIVTPLSKSGKIRILFDTFIEDWSSENAYYEISKVLDLSGEKVDVVLTANDGMAAGVLKALDKSQPGYPVIVTGLDADLAACKSIVNHKQSMTVYKPFKKQAAIAAEMAMDIANSKKITATVQTTFNGQIEVPTVSLQPTSVDESNIKSTVIADGFYKEKDLVN